MADASTIHASAVLFGPKAALIRGAAGSGKSRLVLDMIEAAAAGALPFARLVADDRVLAQARAGRLLLSPPPALAGLIEVRGLGIRRLPYDALATAGLVIDLAAPDGTRYPAREAAAVTIEGISVPRLAVAPGTSALPLVLAMVKLPAAND
jgi:hypothetical protein